MLYVSYASIMMLLQAVSFAEMANDWELRRNTLRDIESSLFQCSLCPNQDKLTREYGDVSIITAITVPGINQLQQIALEEGRAAFKRKDLLGARKSFLEAIKVSRLRGLDEVSIQYLVSSFTAILTLIVFCRLN